MAQVIWTEGAILDLREIAEYIAFDNPEAAANVVTRIESHVDKLSEFPHLGPVIPETPRSLARQVVEPPCRIFYHVAGELVYILHVLRFERLLRQSMLEREDD